MDELIHKNEVLFVKKYIEEKGLYIASKKDFKKLAKIAADSFRDYPLHVWFSNGKYNAKIVYRIILVTLRTMYKNAVIYADSDEFKGFCVWLPSGFSGTKTLPFLLSGGGGLVFRGGLKIVNKLISFEKFAMELKHKYTNDLAWYLYDLTIIPEEQGKGIASKLVKPLLEYFDLKQMPCYLETNKEKNVTLYKHFGFELMEHQIVPNSNVPHYAMLRKPKQED